jgi:hypothetical protein
MTDNTYYLNMAKNVLMEIKKSVVCPDDFQAGRGGETEETWYWRTERLKK